VERSSGAAPPLSSGGSGEPEDGQFLTVRIEPMGSNASVVSLAGELDLSTIPRVEKRLFGEVRSKAGVVVDLSDVSFIDSSGIALLIHAFRQADGGGVLNTVISEGSQVDRVFRLAGIGRALPLFTDRSGALEALNGSASD
jgi:anti-sigma B factor antagonist